MKKKAHIYYCSKQTELCYSIIQQKFKIPSLPFHSNLQLEYEVWISLSAMLIYRHAHQVTFDKSDLLFISMLEPLSYDLNIDESEIEAAKVMKRLLYLENYIKNQFLII